MIFLGPEDTQGTWSPSHQSREVATMVEGAPRGGRARPLPCGPLAAPLTYFFRLYILKYSKTYQESHKNTLPPLQPSVPVRSHLGAFSGILPEGDSITEAFYINSIALPMKRE